MEGWLSELAAGNGPAAWRRFEERYRRLILATIQRLVQDEDEVMEIYAAVVAALAGDDCSRLRRYSDRDPSGASVATWLVVVVRNQTVDWLRKQHGRRPTAPADLTGFPRDLYLALCRDGASPTEAFEQLRARSGLALTFAEFLREVRQLRRTHPCPDAVPRLNRTLPLAPDLAVPVGADLAEVAEAAHRLADALAALPPDLRLAVQLFVVDEVPAARVATIVGWPNAKAVYNRVYRALEGMREVLEREGIGRDDL